MTDQSKQRIKWVPVDDTVEGFPISYTRRRYGNSTFTWVSFYTGEEWIECGDPWQAIKPKRTEILQAIRTMLELRAA